MNLCSMKERRIRIAILIGVCLLMFSLIAIVIRVNAKTTKIGTVVGITSSLNFRNAPGNGDIIGSLYNGQTGEILDQTTVSGTIWYQMSVEGRVGWASSKYIEVTEYTLTDDADYDAYLTAQGFPESYKSKLQELHSRYPNWVFEAQHTGLNWDDAIEAENELGKSLVHNSSVTSWKSLQDGAYNWSTGTWNEIDSGGWVAASKEIIEYSMDPRNFLDSTNIFQFVNQSYNTSAMTNAQIAQKKADLTNMVKGTYLAGTCDGRSYVDVIMDAASSSGVCPMALASMMIQEQGSTGYGGCISGTESGYVGYYNYFNIGAYKTASMSAVQRGLWYAKGSGVGATSYGRPWNTRTKSIAGGASYYGLNYVKQGQDTLYLKKFNVQGNNLYEHQYMTNVLGAIDEGKKMANGYNENARQGRLVFKIPVYKNMPESVCLAPTSNDDPNNMLIDLDVIGYSMTPTFSIHKTEYSVIVPHDVSTVFISGTRASDTSTVTGRGQQSLEVGTNVFKIICTSQSGKTRTYTVTIVRQTPPTPSVPSTPGTPSKPTSSVYQINSNNTITGIKKHPVTVGDFTKQFSVGNGSVKVTTSTGTNKTGNVGTGNQLRVYDTADKLSATYNIIIYGDTTGDGKVSLSDLTSLQRDMLGIKKLSGVYFTAGDCNRDGKISLSDLTQIQRKILNIKDIQQ